MFYWIRRITNRVTNVRKKVEAQIPPGLHPDLNIPRFNLAVDLYNYWRARYWAERYPTVRPSAARASLRNKIVKWEIDGPGFVEQGGMWRIWWDTGDWSRHDGATLLALAIDFEGQIEMVKRLYARWKGIDVSALQ